MSNHQSLSVKDFYYELPAAQIARYPLPSRSESRLMVIDSQAKHWHHRQFRDLLAELRPGDLLVCNDTKVIPARLWGRKQTGGRVEMLIERLLGANRVLAQLRVSKPPKPGDELFFDQSVRFAVIKRDGSFYELMYTPMHPEAPALLEAIEAIGQIPLPPYLHRQPDEDDKARYQTIYAKYKGSVAAPTAGLHFDDALWQSLHQHQIEIGYLTLHIGAGTFAPIRVQQIADHAMHAEYIEVSETLCQQVAAAKARGNRVIAVGTTSLRALETASATGSLQPYQGETRIFIYPGYQFHCVDALITNFHLPESTLLMLVCAFGGYSLMMDAYREAVRLGYRFYSYGDAMLIA